MEGINTDGQDEYTVPLEVGDKSWKYFRIYLHSEQRGQFTPTTTRTYSAMDVFNLSLQVNRRTSTEMATPCIAAVQVRTVYGLNDTYP